MLAITTAEEKCQNVLKDYEALREMLVNENIPAIEEVIKNLEKLLEKARLNRRNCLIAKTTGTSVAGVGSVLSVLSIALAPFTVGLSLPILGGTGLAMGVLGSATSIGTSIVDQYFLEPADLEDVKKLFEKVIEIQTKYDEMRSRNNIVTGQSGSYLQGIKHYEDLPVSVEDLQEGDHIYRKISGFLNVVAFRQTFHHGVVLPDDESLSVVINSRRSWKVVHFGKEYISGGPKEKYSVRIDSLEKFLDESTEIFRRNYQGLAIPVQETKDKAYEIIGEEDKQEPYNLLTNNCEHFATFLKLKMGKWSEQVERAEKILWTFKAAPRPITMAVDIAEVVTASMFKASGSISTKWTEILKAVGFSSSATRAAPRTLSGLSIAAVTFAPIMTAVDIGLLVHDFLKDQTNIVAIEDAIKKMTAQKTDFGTELIVLEQAINELKENIEKKNETLTIPNSKFYLKLKQA